MGNCRRSVIRRSVIRRSVIRRSIIRRSVIRRSLGVSTVQVQHLLGLNVQQLAACSSTVCVTINVLRFTLPMITVHRPTDFTFHIFISSTVPPTHRSLSSHSLLTHVQADHGSILAPPTYRLPYPLPITHCVLTHWISTVKALLV